MFIFRIFYPLSLIIIDVESIIFVSQYLNIYLYMDRAYEFTSTMKISYFMYWSYMLIWMFAFAKSYEII